MVSASLLLLSFLLRGFLLALGPHNVLFEQVNSLHDGHLEGGVVPTKSEPTRLPSWTLAKFFANVEVGLVMIVRACLGELRQQASSAAVLEVRPHVIVLLFEGAVATTLLLPMLEVDALPRPEVIAFQVSRRHLLVAHRNFLLIAPLLVFQSERVDLALAVTVQIGATKDHQATTAELFIVVGDHCVLPTSHGKLSKHCKSLPLHQIQVEDAYVVQGHTVSLSEDLVVATAVNDQNLMSLLL